MTVVYEEKEERYTVFEHDLSGGDAKTKPVAHFPKDEQKVGMDGSDAIMFDVAQTRATTFSLIYEQMNNRGDLDRLSRKSIKVT